jgi:hypothetical protein
MSALSTDTGSRPVPDPTLLTTQQLIRENLWLREVLETRLTGIQEANLLRQNNTNARFEAYDKAIKLLQDISDKFPGRIDEKIHSLKEVHEEKFASIQVQFRERDVRTEQSSKDSKVAVDAALQAAKEAVGEQNKSSALAIAKSEASTTKQIDQQGLLIQSTAKASDEKIDDIKERLTRIEGGGKGMRDMVGWIVAGIFLLIAVIGFIERFGK